MTTSDEHTPECGGPHPGEHVCPIASPCCPGQGYLAHFTGNDSFGGSYYTCAGCRRTHVIDLRPLTLADVTDASIAAILR